MVDDALDLVMGSGSKSRVRVGFGSWVGFGKPLNDRQRPTRSAVSAGLNLKVPNFELTEFGKTEL